MRCPTDEPLRKTAAWLYARGDDSEHGANVVPLQGKRVKPKWKKWQSNRQPLDVVDAYDWQSATGTGVLHGVNGWRCFDFDDCPKYGPVETFVRALGLPDYYPWIIESGSGKGYHVWIRCGNDGAFDNKEVWLPKEEGDFDHVEVRWNRHQTVVPPSVHPDTGATYEFFTSRTPEKAPWEIGVKTVQEALSEIARPKRSERSEQSGTSRSSKSCFSRSRSSESRSPQSKEHADPEVEDIESALNALPDSFGKDYDDWLKVIMAVRDGAPNDRVAKSLLKDWRSEWEPGEHDKKLQSLDDGPPEGVDPVTVGSLFGHAQDHGWKGTGSSWRRVERIVKQVEEKGAGAGLIFQHLDAFARLDTADFAVAKEKVSGAVNLNDFTRAVREKERELQRRDFEKESDLPTIQLSDRPGREIVDEATNALHDWNDPPELFQRGTEPVQIATDEQGMPVVRELPDAVLDDCLDRAADFFRTSQKRGPIREDLSMRYVERIRETVELPPLEGIVEVPVLRPNGSILRNPGYDEDSRLFYSPDESLSVPPIPESPSDGDVQEALETIWTPLQDFPFVDRASKANALALMLTPVVRPYLGAQNVPLALVDATVQGTGKTLFVTVLSLINTGRPAATMSAPDSDEEWRKQITAQLLQGASMIVVDNVRGRLRSTPLEQAITTSLWQDRILGKSEQAEIPQRATWIATGNNVQPKGDMKRHVYPIRMDAEMERPWMGREFEIENLEQWTKAHRGELVSALLTLARSWFGDGAPSPDAELLGSFKEWTRTVGGILEHAGVEGFLGNLGQLYKQMGEETAEWAGFLEALYVHFAGEAEHGNREDSTFTSKELGQLIRDNYRDSCCKDPDLQGKHVGTIIDTLPDNVLKKLNRGDPISRTLGNMFAHRRGRRFGPEQWRIEVAATEDRAKRWTVRRK